MDWPPVIPCQLRREPTRLTMDSERKIDRHRSKRSVYVPFSPPLVDGRHHSSPMVGGAWVRLEQL